MTASVPFERWDGALCAVVGCEDRFEGVLVTANRPLGCVCRAHGEQLGEPAEAFAWRLDPEKAKGWKLVLELHEPPQLWPPGTK